MNKEDWNWYMFNYNYTPQYTQYCKQYYEDNKEEIKKKRRELYYKNMENIEYRKKELERSRSRKEYFKQYYLRKKNEKINKNA